MKKTYFASDFHLGINGRLTSKERERQLVRWLDEIKTDAETIYLVGDVFDYWFEYQYAVPKGYVRLFGKLAELRDTGIQIYFFIGNHDMWMFKYFEEELDIPIIRKPVVHTIHGKTFFIGHGDGLGPADYGYKFLKKIFSNRLCQWLFERVHPNYGLWLMKFWSGRSRLSSPAERVFLGVKKEWLIAYCHRKLKTVHADYFVFGHRHLPIDYTLNNQGSRYLNLGDWLFFNSYAVFDGYDIQIQFFENEEGTVFGNE